MKTEIIAYLNNMRYARFLDRRLRIIKLYPFINAVGAECDECMLDELKNSPFIEHITEGGKVFALSESTVCVSKNTSLSDYDGKGVTLCVLDTGVNPHLDLCFPVNRLKESVDFVENKNYAYDDNGHGTFVAGAAAGSGVVSGGKIKGSASAIDIVSVKVIGSNGECGVFNVLDGVEWILKNSSRLKIRVVCMSFGSEPQSTHDPLERAAEALVDSGLVVVCAAGNSGEGMLKSPATSPSVISVGAVNADGKRAEFSSTGIIGNIRKPEIYAPGVNIDGLSNKGVYTKMSGTSVSAPIVAGYACRILQKYPNLRPWQVKSILINNSAELK